MANMRGMGPNEKRELNTKFKVIKFLGKGSYGSVFQVQRLSDNKTYALKEMDVRAMNQAEREDSANEIRLLASVAHPNVISYNEAFLDGNRLCIIMEYAPDGDLAKVIKKFQMMKRAMPEDLNWKYFIQIARGLSALHNMKILHRDMKPGNIMIMQNDVAKIGDLGIAKLLRHTMAKTQIGTPHYMPPEIWRNKPYGFTSDSWAMGCLMYEMATNSVPFEAKSMNELKYKVLRGTYPPLPSTCSRDLQQMVARCLDQNPDRRPSMDEILSSTAVMSRMHLVSSVEPQHAKPPSTASSVLLDTIKVPRNFQMLKGKLPPAVYASDPNRFGMIEEDEDEGSEAERLPMMPQRVMKQAPPASAGAIAAAQYGIMRKQANQQANQLPLMPQARVYAESAVDNTPPMGAQRAGGNNPGGYNPYGAPKGPPQPLQMPIQQQQGAYGNADATPWYKSKAPQQSESHAAYGAFYKSPTPAAAQAAAKGGLGAQGWPAAAMFGQFTPAQQLVLQQQAVAAAQYRAQLGGGGGYNPYGQQQQQQGGGGNRGPYPAKLPSLAAQQQQAAMARLAAPVRAPPWNFGGGAQAKARAAGLVPTPLQQQPQVQRYPPPQWASPKAAARW